jgi:hypothetical protein
VVTALCMVIHWLVPLQENTVESVKSPKLSAGLPSTLLRTAAQMGMGSRRSHPSDLRLCAHHTKSLCGTIQLRRAQWSRARGGVP